MKSTPLFLASALFLPTPELSAEATCQPTPERLIVLGDSIMSCHGVGGKDDPNCGPKQFHQWLNLFVSPGLSYENLSKGGARTVHVAEEQIFAIDEAEGHALVLIYIGGNDLQALLYMPDNLAAELYPEMKASLQEYWAEIYDYLEDPQNFPDGATIMINTQYNPFDDCYGTSEIKIDLLADYNQMIASFSEDMAARYTADPYTLFLGHGHNYQRRTCPHYQPNSDYWMGDLIHPNLMGHGHLGDLWGDYAATLYLQCE